jgi:hypothetical protein
MVRRDDDRTPATSRSRNLPSCCEDPAGESPASVSAGAPSSRPAAEGEIPTAEAGRQKRARQQKLFSTEQARGPQHEVKPAASTEKQPESRAGHVAAKATTSKRATERNEDLGGVWGAARVQGSSRNTRDPSAQPLSRLGGGNRPEAKATIAQRKSDRAIVCAEQRADQAGLSPAGARTRGAVSKGGGNASPAGASAPEGRVPVARRDPKGMRRSIRPQSMGAIPKTNRSAKGGTRSSLHYGGEGALVHPPHQGVCGRHDAEDQRVTSGGLTWFPGGSGGSIPISVSEMGSGATRVVGQPSSTRSAVKAVRPQERRPEWVGEGGWRRRLERTRTRDEQSQGGGTVP